MTIGLLSLFRNMEGRLSSYFSQAVELRRLLSYDGHDLVLLSVFGDCTDRTAEFLAQMAEANHFDMLMIPAHHGGPVYGSTEQPERLKALSFVVNAGLKAVDRITPALDAVIYVESDLQWDALVWVNLLAELEPGYDVVAPLIFAGKSFYDVWGFRQLDGTRFSSRWAGSDGDLFEVGSVGSGFVMRGDVARKCRITNDQALVGFCDDVRAKGYRIWVDPTERIVHPV